MGLSSDWTDLLAAFDAEGVEYLIVGGYAVALHGRPRFTKDLDLWVGDTPDNLGRVERALRVLGAPEPTVGALRSASLEDVVWMGRPPSRIDLVKGIPGVRFADCYTRRVMVEWSGRLVPVIARDDLILAKRASGRPQDLVDADALSR